MQKNPSLFIVCFVTLALASCGNNTTQLLTHDMSGITFTDASYDYDGTTKKLEIFGKLPLGVSVSYSNNTLTSIGSVEATAHFYTTLANYRSIPDMKATLTINATTTQPPVDLPSPTQPIDVFDLMVLLEERDATLPNFSVDNVHVLLTVSPPEFTGDESLFNLLNTELERYFSVFPAVLNRYENDLMDLRLTLEMVEFYESSGYFDYNYFICPDTNWVKLYSREIKPIMSSIILTDSIGDSTVVYDDFGLLNLAESNSLFMIETDEGLFASASFTACFEWDFSLNLNGIS